MTDPVLPASGVDRAALAFSILSRPCADVVNKRLSISERIRLREGLTRNRDAPDELRVAAFKTLAHEVRRGLTWPRPSMHDESDCPFMVLTAHPRTRVIDVITRVAGREPLEAAVAMCHLPDAFRADVWAGIATDTQEKIIKHLDEVHGVSNVRSRSYARDLTIRINQATRRSRVAPGLRA
jgi:hypothetical protein